MNWEYLTQASPAIKLHLIAALLALGLGSFIWARPKGTTKHKWVGRGFISAMLLAALTAILIRDTNNGQFSLIHIFVPITIIGCWQAVYYIRKGNIPKHKTTVKSLFFYALIIPGILAMTPPRLIWKTFFGP